MQGDGEKREKINTYLEKNYQGDLRNPHYLEILQTGHWFSPAEGEAEQAADGAEGGRLLRLHAPRPFEEMEFDDKERPTVFEAFSGDPRRPSSGISPTRSNWPAGSFQSVGAPDVATECGLQDPCLRPEERSRGGCLDLSHVHVNIDPTSRPISRQSTWTQDDPCPSISLNSLGLPWASINKTLGFEQNFVDPLPVLKTERPSLR